MPESFIWVLLCYMFIVQVTLPAEAIKLELDQPLKSALAGQSMKTKKMRRCVEEVTFDLMCKAISSFNSESSPLVTSKILC